ncbi:MAG TPA: hypothetical protein VFG62_16995 [Rhodopila sp.]|nr:hypothetical protein [Rhodopila sp.]
MKRLWTLILLAAVVQPAFADDAAPPKRTHMSWEQRFTEANTTHDGHLTIDQAKLGYKTVARHFRNIDVDGKGFVTENDIRAWHALQKAARHNKGAEDPLRPRPAFNRFMPDQRPTVAPSQTMLTTPQRPALLTTPQPPALLTTLPGPAMTAPPGPTMMTTPQPPAMLTTPQPPALLTTPQPPAMLTTPPGPTMVNLDQPGQAH